MTSAEINALPEHVRKHIHDLETNCDPAGLVQTNQSLREQVRAMRARIVELEAEAKKARSWAPENNLQR